MKPKAAPKKPPTASEKLEQARTVLEGRIFALCLRFEADTGLRVYTIRHPRDSDGDNRLPNGPLEKNARVQVGAVVPFVGPGRLYR